MGSTERAWRFWGRQAAEAGPRVLAGDPTLAASRGTVPPARPASRPAAAGAVGSRPGERGDVPSSQRSATRTLGQRGRAGPRASGA